jgi:hypothetical protein
MKKGRQDVIRQRFCAAALLALAALYGPQAFAQTVVDGSDRAIPADVRGKLLDIVRAQGGPQAQLRNLRRADSAGSIIYCGRLRAGGGDFVPVLINVTAGLAYALTDNLTGMMREAQEARLKVYRCL